MPFRFIRARVTQATPAALSAPVEMEVICRDVAVEVLEPWNTRARLVEQTHNDGRTLKPGHVSFFEVCDTLQGVFTW
jgi:hypothetical protein